MSSCFSLSDWKWSRRRVACCRVTSRYRDPPKARFRLKSGIGERNGGGGLYLQLTIARFFFYLLQSLERKGRIEEKKNHKKQPPPPIIIKGALSFDMPRASYNTNQTEREEGEKVFFSSPFLDRIYRMYRRGGPSERYITRAAIWFLDPLVSPFYLLFQGKEEERKELPARASTRALISCWEKGCQIFHTAADWIYHTDTFGERGMQNTFSLSPPLQADPPLSHLWRRKSVNMYKYVRAGGPRVIVFITMLLKMLMLNKHGAMNKGEKSLTFRVLTTVSSYLSVCVCNSNIKWGGSRKG